MAGIRLTPEEPDMPVGTPPRPQLPPSVAGAGSGGGSGSGGLEMASDDERSVAADSWSVRSEYGSTLDDDQRYADAAEVLAAAAASANFPSAASDYWYCTISAELSHSRPNWTLSTSRYRSIFSKHFLFFNVIFHLKCPCIETVLIRMIKILVMLKDRCWVSKAIGMLLIQKILQIFRNMGMLEKYGDHILSLLISTVKIFTLKPPVCRFGADVMDTVAAWTKSLCNIIQGGVPSGHDDIKSEVDEKLFSNYPVLDVGTGNGLLLQALAKQGYYQFFLMMFTDLTGTDYSEGAVELARNLAARDGFTSIKFLVRIHVKSKLFLSCPTTLVSVKFHSLLLWVITSCNHTKDELLQEVEDFSKRKFGKENMDEGAGLVSQIFRYIDHVRTYPTIMFGGVEGSQVCTVAFQRM
ncbi:hypothetical protein HU200_036941 [Digitaria exilis]|uniref:Methyltransferase domain-containing protein n=1 Tax=Digitaria exilis TaxID=1010633 RepID=A0A835EKC3_9POAL|nr:hypothetical protein HU200_036941 [Digitaria exilis]